MLLLKSNKDILKTLSLYLPLFCENSLKPYYIRLFQRLHDELLQTDFLKNISPESKREYYFLFKNASIHPVFKQEQHSLSLWSDNFFGDLKIITPQTSNASDYSPRSSRRSSSSSMWPEVKQKRTISVNLLEKNPYVNKQMTCKQFFSEEKKQQQSMINSNYQH